MAAHELKVDPYEFDGKHALVTGGTKGIGQAVAARLHDARPKVLTPVLFLLVCVCSLLSAQTQVAKVTKIKLEDYGWQPVPNKRQFGHTFSQNLWIDHKGRALVGFTVRENQALATREHPGRSFHILRFTAEGKADLSLVLPTNDWYKNGFYLGPDDQIFARANDTLQFFLEERSQRQSESWQPLAPCPENCFISQSFSHRTLILRVRGRDRSTYTILDASSSPPRVVRTCPQMASIKITDKFAYVVGYDKDDDLTVRFPFCDVEHYEDLPQWGRGGGYVLNDETLLKFDPTGTILLGPGGQVKFSLKMPKHDSIDPYKITTDERYDRLAFVVATIRGEHPLLDIGGHLVARRVLVLDETGEQLASIPTDTNYHMDSNFAMSPDGHRLAVLDEGVVVITDLQ